MRRPAERLKVMVTQDVLTRALLFYTNDPRIPQQRLSMSLDYGRHELEAFLRQYLRDIVTNGYATKEEIDLDLPNVYRYSAQAQVERERIVYALPPPQISKIDLSAYMALQAKYIQGAWDPQPALPPPEPEFEVNMMECLVGWKGWNLAPSDELLHSPSYQGTWHPDEPFKATCPSCGTPPAKVVVYERHTCGIYATDGFSGAKAYGTIRGQVYGWGRYVRGDKGWRSQFAYPKSFHLTSDQANFIEPLKKYHVPIFIDEPLRVYDPEEEGYGYGNTEENRDSGAVEGTDSGEKGGASSEATES